MVLKWYDRFSNVQEDSFTKYIRYQAKLTARPVLTQAVMSAVSGLNAMIDVADGWRYSSVPATVSPNKPSKRKA